MLNMLHHFSHVFEYWIVLGLSIFFSHSICKSFHADECMPIDASEVLDVPLWGEGIHLLLHSKDFSLMDHRRPPSPGMQRTFLLI